MTELFYFVHGTTCDNEKGLASGQNDVPLSDKGINQAKNLKNLINKTNFDVIFCSDLLRAKQTAKIIFDGKDIIYDSRLRECNYGNLNGKSNNLVDYSCHVNIPFPGGESLNDVLLRISDFLDFIKNNYCGKKIAIISHRAPQLAIMVKTKNITFNQAISSDWRRSGNWQPGWRYVLD